MKALEQFQHGTVLVVEQSPRYVDTEVGIDADEVLVEGAVVDRAETEPVADDGVAGLLGVGDDVGCVEQADLLQPADGAAVAVGGQHRTAELRLVDPLLDLSDDVTALDLVGDVHGLTFVVGAAHLPEREQHAELAGQILLHERRVDGAVPVRTRTDEVDDRHVEQMCIAQPAVEVVVGIVVLVGVEDAVRRLLVHVAVLPDRAVDRQRGRPALRLGGAVDAVGAVEEGNPASAEVEALRERTVGNVGTPLSLQDVEGREAGTPDVVVAHVGIVRAGPRLVKPGVVVTPDDEGPRRRPLVPIWPESPVRLGHLGYELPTSSRCSCRSRGRCSTSRCAPCGRRSASTRPHPPSC